MIGIKRSLMSSVFSLLCVLANASNVKAELLEFTIKGNVIESPCNIVLGDGNMLSVLMGTINAQDFSSIGSETEPVAFSIKLEDCELSVAQTAKVTFSQVGNTSDLLNTQCDGSDCGFKVGLRDGNGNITLGQMTAGQSLNSGSTELKFYSYLRRTLEKIKPGEFSASGQFEVSYE